MTRSRKIVVLGTGHVGLVTVATLASFGHQVVGFDVNPEVIDQLNAGEVHFYEPGLKELVVQGLNNHQITFSADPAQAIAGADVAMICVGTPNGGAGLDLSMVREAALTVITHATNPIVLVEKSTVPPGTGDRIEALVARHNAQDRVRVASNPEFLREGQAVADTLTPDRIVVGANDPQTHAVMADVYATQLEAHPCPYMATDRTTAEIIKQASNAFLATKISFINEIAALCEAVGADVNAVADGMGHDPRIGRAFLNAGIGFGGSCFPKDVEGLASVFEAHHVPNVLVHHLSESNALARSWAIRTLEVALWGLRDTTIAVLGAAFKPHTDDIRESVPLAIVRELLNEGAKVRIADPVALPKVAAVLEHPNLTLANSAQAAINGADAVLLGTEWPEYVALNPTDIAQWLASPVAVDGRIQWDGAAFEAAGLHVYQVGRRAQR